MRFLYGNVALKDTTDLQLSSMKNCLRLNMGYAASAKDHRTVLGYV